MPRSDRNQARPDNSERRSARGASSQQLGWRSRLKSWLANHQWVAVESLLKLISNPASSLLTWLVVAISLSLPGVLWMAVDNLQQLSGSVQQSGQMSVYLDTGMSADAVNRLDQQVLALDGVVHTRVISPDVALEQLQHSTGMADVLALLPGNPLPSVLLVEPSLALTRAEVVQLRDQLASFNGVASVELDLQWLDRLQGFLTLTERAVLILGGLLALGIVLVVGNTLRLAIAARVDEIRIVKLVGATNAWVRRPFLYTGLWYGMVGGVLSWGLLIVCWLLLLAPVEQLVALYGGDFSLQPLSAGAALVLLLAGMLLGWAGAWWAVSRHLDEIEP